VSRFISIEAVPVHTDDDPANVIYIKPKMDYATLTKVRSAVVGTKSDLNLANIHMSLDLVAANLALLTNNIVRWSGPDFDNTPCNAENIGRIDPDDPLLDKVLSEINRRNPQGAKSPNSSSANGKNDSMLTIAPTKQAGSRRTSPQ
jgi:hypothetical protein